MVSEFVFGAWLTLASTLILILAGVLGWLAKQYIDLRGDLQQVTNSYFGIADQEGSRQRLFDELDELQEQVDGMQVEMREAHQSVDEDLSDIIETLEDHDINGNLPDDR